MKQQSASETIARCCRQRPVFGPFLSAFAPILTGRQKTAEKLAPLLAEAGKTLDALPGEQPLLKARPPEGMGSFIRIAAKEMLPLLAALDAVSPHKSALDNFYLNQENDCALDSLLSAMLAESSDALLQLSQKYGLDPQILEFTAEFIISAVLRALAVNLEDEEFPDWRKSKCPVCGSLPVIAWLSRRPPVENGAFLADGGGKKHLHCGMCGMNWHFTRGICPACGTQGQDAMQILGEEDKRHERIDWCKKCQTYLPQIDLRELAETPDMDAMALGMMHLDLAAAEKGLIPLKPSFWNMF